MARPLRSIVIGGVLVALVFAVVGLTGAVASGGLAEPSELPVDRAPARSDIRVDHNLPPVDVPSPPLINGVTPLAAPWRRAGSRQSSCSTIV